MNGRVEEMDARDILRLCGVVMGGTGGISVELPYHPLDDGGRLGGVPLIVPDLSSGSTLVELFHLCLLLPDRSFTVEFTSTLAGDESGVRL